MINSESIRTPVFLRATSGTNRLSSPFAKNYLLDEWTRALELAIDNDRDVRLCLAAIYFGAQISSLREQLVTHLFEGISKRSVLTLSVATANRNFFAIQRSFKENNKKVALDKSVNATHLSDIGNYSVDISPQANLSADELITAIVDCLPHFFFEAKDLGNVREPLTTNFGDLERRAGFVLSIEAGLRDLWNSALWEGRGFKKENEKIIFGPFNKDAAYFWFACQMRAEAALLGPIALFSDHSDERKDISHLRCPIIFSDRRGRAILKAGKPLKKDLRNLAETLNVLEQSYLKEFLDEEIKFKDSFFSARMLVQALWVISLAGRCLQSLIRATDIQDYFDAREFSLRVGKADCIDIVAQCLGLDRAVSKSICAFLTLSPDDTARSFNEGVWIHPLIELDDENVMIVMPSVAAGSKVRFVERSLIGLLGPDLTSVKSLGENFEQRTRLAVHNALSDNPIITDYCVLPHAIKKGGDGGEEIDLVFRIGRTIVVCELKCLLAPNESMERFNHLIKLEHAAKQAQRKVDWLTKNVHIIELPLKVDGGANDLNIVPLVVLNHRIGSGLVIENVVVTDVFVLNLFLGDGAYASGAAISRGGKAIVSETWYKTQTEAEVALPAVFAPPPPLKPFLAGSEWTTIEFPVATGSIGVELPKLKQNSLVTPELEAAADVLASRL